MIEALATLAYDGRRGAFFEAELIAALAGLDGYTAVIDARIQTRRPAAYWGAYAVTKAALEKAIEDIRGGAKVEEAGAEETEDRKGEAHVDSL